MSASMPLHLLPPHIKLQILNSLPPQPAGTAPPYSSSATTPSTSTSTTTQSSSPSTTSVTPATASTSLPATHFTSAPLFNAASLSPTTPLPAPFTAAALTQLLTRGHCTVDHFLPSNPTTSSPLASLHDDVSRLLATNAFTGGHMVAASDAWRASDLRGDQVCWLSNDRPGPPSIAYVLAALHAAVGGLAGVLDGLPCVASSSQLALYEAGGRYVRHLDVRRGERAGPVRRLTAIVYLNEGWEAGWGGQLRLYERCGVDGQDEGEGERSVDVLPVWGRLLLFASEEVEHEVLPATKRRVALTTWFK